MIEFIKSIDGVVIKLLKHIKTTAVIDIIMKLISMDDISGSQGIVDVSNNSSEARVIMWSYYTFLLLCGVIIPFCYYGELLQRSHNIFLLLQRSHNIFLLLQRPHNIFAAPD